jgi:deoxyribodipyrimidine photo-lyase
VIVSASIPGAATPLRATSATIMHYLAEQRRRTTMASEAGPEGGSRAGGGGEGGDGASIVWFRNDLRVADNPALHAAQARGKPVAAIFILESDNGLRPLGEASRWWLHHSLEALGAALKKIGLELHLFEGAAGRIVPDLAGALGAGALFFNRRYGAAARELDGAVEAACARSGCAVETFNGRLLHEPDDIHTKAGGSYGVYSPYARAALAKGLPDRPLPKPRRLASQAWKGKPAPCTLDALGLLPTKPDWAAGWRDRWSPGETGAAKNLRAFLKDGLEDYPTARNDLAVTGSSHLSPHLRFGEISPRQIVAAVNKAAAGTSAKKLADSAEKYVAEILWRDFDYHVLFHHPDLAERNLHGQFDRMPWRKVSKATLAAWQKGQTGFPVVDAGMRELWQTGYMHNRVRMITASFLIKDLLYDWRIGEKWFWDCLVDADPANNTMNWQWVAGSGADASPFFRVFNPVTQGRKFDPEGVYIRQWVPELAKLGKKAVHEPWLAPAGELEKAAVALGETYPRPILDHKTSRDAALAAYRTLKR